MPQLLDEIIGQIFTHLGPKTLGLCEWKNIDHKTLGTCCLVSHQFAFWARHILYRRIHIRSPKGAASYLSLFRRHVDMSIHIKTVEVTIMPPLWIDGEAATESGFNDLATLLDKLAEEGSVNRCHFRFVIPWDRVNMNFQISLHRFLFSHPFETIELAGICPCFMGIWAIPFPWLTKRFNLLRINTALGEEDGETYFSCPEWEKDRRGLSLEKGSAKNGRVLSKELKGTYDSLVKRLIKDGVIHPEKTKLESLWIPGHAANIFETFLARPETGVCIGRLRELQFTNVDDDNIPDVARVLEGCKGSLESLHLSNIQVKSATSSNLSLLTSTGLPHLQTLTIAIRIASGGHTKSLAWYLLHARRNGQFRIKSLNLIFLDLAELSSPTLSDRVTAAVRNNLLICQLFEAFRFFKFEKLLYDVLASEPTNDMGKASLWFMLANAPGVVDEVIIEEWLQKDFPNLLREKRITSSVGDYDEVFNLEDALSIHPEGPAQTRYDASDWRATEKGLKDTVIRPALKFGTV